MGRYMADHGERLSRRRSSYFYNGEKHDLRKPARRPNLTLGTYENQESPSNNALDIKNF